MCVGGGVCRQACLGSITVDSGSSLLACRLHVGAYTSSTHARRPWLRACSHVYAALGGCLQQHLACLPCCIHSMLAFRARSCASLPAPLFLPSTSCISPGLPPLRCFRTPEIIMKPPLLGSGELWWCPLSQSCLSILYLLAVARGTDLRLLLKDPCRCRCRCRCLCLSSLISGLCLCLCLCL